MATITFFTRSTNPDKKVNVRVRFRHGKKINIYAKSGLEVFPQQFSNETHNISQRVNYEDKAKDRKYLNSLDETIQKEYKDLKDLPTSYWLNKVIDKFRFPEKYEAKPITLFSFIRGFIDKAPTRVNPKSGRPVCYKMQREYARTFHFLKEFCIKKNREYDFKDIDLDFYEDFVEYLLSQGLATNTTGKKIQTLKVFLNAATDKGVNTSLKFKSRRFYTLTEESENIYLTPGDLQKLYDLDLSTNKRLEKVRDLFMVGCWTGLRFSDLKQVKPDNIKNELISIKQQKTGAKVIIPLQPIIKEILKKYDGVLPRPISNQNFNKYLKEVAKKAKLNTPFEKTITKGGLALTKKHKKWELTTTHTARRSFATNLYKSGFPAISIMAITGHKTETSFLKYVKVTPEEHAKLLIEHWRKEGSHLKVAR